MKLASIFKSAVIAAPLVMATLLATGEPAEAHHLDAANHDSFSCKRNDLAGLNKVDLIKKLLPVTTLITIEKTISPSLEDQLFNLLDPNLGENKDKTERFSGSGFFIDPRGFVITNHHVIEDATKIMVYTYDPLATNEKGMGYEAKLIGTDPKVDIAVLKIENNGNTTFPCVDFADSNTIERGQKVLAIGAPLGLNYTVTDGMVSTFNRFLPDGKNKTNPNPNPLRKLIQSNVSTNPGNSGGPLFNEDGQVVGVNTMIVDRAGISFAINANAVAITAQQLLKHKHMSHGRMGIGIMPLSPERAKKKGIPGAHGIEITGVVKGAAGDKAGLQKGDIILSVGGHETGSDVNELAYQVNMLRAGEAIDIIILRDGQHLTGNITLDGKEYTTKDLPLGDQFVPAPAPPHLQQPVPPFGEPPPLPFGKPPQIPFGDTPQAP